MNKIIYINKKINNFKKKITVEGDKSLSIRWALLASQAFGKSRAYNLLNSEDVLNTLSCLKKLGVKIPLEAEPTQPLRIKNINKNNINLLFIF